MSELEARLQRWMSAGLLSEDQAARIRTFEQTSEPERRVRWPVIAALVFGTLMLGAGVVLFVGAHWDRLSPMARMSVVLAAIVAFHVAGALMTERSPGLSSALHGVGTAALGAGISVSGQIFHLEEHWSDGAMLWTAGAWIAWWLRRDWVQTCYVALITPAWVAGEWIHAVVQHGRSLTGGEIILGGGSLALSFTYLFARERSSHEPYRYALETIGLISLIPTAISAILMADYGSRAPRLPLPLMVIGCAVALGAPILLGWVLRRGETWVNAVAASYSLVLAYTSAYASDVAVYPVSAIGAAGIVALGVRDQRRGWINVGIAGFAITIAAFFFSSVMDRLGRSASLMIFGILFLAGGWYLEQWRRSLLARIGKDA